MQELFKRHENKMKYQEDILDTDFIGVLSEKDERVILVKDSYGNFIGMTRDDSSKNSKWSENTKSKYVKNFSKVFEFDSEEEMMLWYNNNN